MSLSREISRVVEQSTLLWFETTDSLKTSMDGVFAAGDVRAGSTKQAISAAGEGATAALMIRQCLKSLGEVNPVNTIEREILEVRPPTAT